MRIRLKKLLIENFKGVRQLELDFGEQTYVFGQNASGKTTVFDAFCWLLFNKNSQGVEKLNVHPLDDNGNRIDNVEIMVEAVLEVDGREVMLKKMQKQNWIKQRCTGAVSLQDNVNSFEVNTVPYSEKEYKDYISSIIEEKIFNFMTNPKEFVSMSWRDQRKMLLRLIGGVTDADVIASDESFASLNELLIDGATVDRLDKKCKKAIVEFKKKQNELSAQIDEIFRQITDIDVIKSELQRNALMEQIANAEWKQHNAYDAFEDYYKKSDAAQEVQIKISEIERAAKNKLLERHQKFHRRIAELRQKRRYVAQKVAEQRKLQDLLERFIRAKMDMLSSKISSRFRLVNFQMFKKQINGGIVECCEATIDGVPYCNLSNAGKVQAGLDIINIFQKINDVLTPVWIDNSESIDYFNLPDMDCQMILLAVSSDEKLRVEVKE